MALVRDGGVDPFNGALYVFRSKRADRVKIVWWDGGGICLFAKTLEAPRQQVADLPDRRSKVALLSDTTHN